MVFLVDALLSDVNLVDGLGRRVNDLCSQGRLPNAESVFVDVLNQAPSLLKRYLRVSFCHPGGEAVALLAIFVSGCKLLN